MSYKVSPLELPTSRAQIFPQAQSVSGRFFMFSAAKASERAGAFCPWAELSTSGYSLKSIQLFLKSLPLSVPKIVNTQVVFVVAVLLLMLHLPYFDLIQTA